MQHHRPIASSHASVLLVLAAFAVAPATAQHTITLAEPAPPAGLTIRTIDEATLGAPQVLLQDLEFLAIEFATRTAQDELRPDRPHRVQRQGVWCLELPDGGRLYRYRLRGGERHGFLLVTANGAPLVVHEASGTGASGKDDPFADRIGLAPDGRHAGIVTSTGALHLARLDGGTWGSTGTPSRPLSLPAAVDPLSVCPGATHTFLQTRDGRVWRSANADATQPQDLTPPHAASDRLKEQMHMSGDGTTVVFLLGPKDLYGIWLLGSSGAAVRLPPPPSKYEEPGYLPEESGGPHLLLNDDASRLYFEDHANRDEAFLLDVSGALPATAVTADTEFQPYIGTIIFPAFSQALLALAVGDPQQFDWYTARAGQQPIANLTRTAGNVTRPWAAGGLVPLAFGTLANGQHLVVDALGGGGTQLRALDPVANTATVLATGVSAAMALGDSVAGPGSRDVLVPSPAGDLYVSSATARVTLAAPAGVTLTPTAVAAGEAFRLLLATAGGARAAVFLLPGGQAVALRDDSLRQAVLTRGGGALLSGAQLRYFAPGRARTLPATGAIVL